MLPLITYKAAFGMICEFLSELNETDDLQSKLAEAQRLKRKADVVVLMEMVKADLEKAMDDDAIVRKYDAIESDLGSATDSFCEILQTLDRSLKEFDIEDFGETFEDIEACVGYLKGILEEEE